MALANRGMGAETELRNTDGVTTHRLWLVLGVLITAGFVFQVFLRYQYIPRGYVITRVDRLNGTVCNMPCTPIPPSTPKPLPTFEDLTIGNSRAIELIKARSDASSITSYFNDRTYEWKVEHEYSTGYGEDFSVVGFVYSIINSAKGSNGRYTFPTMAPNAAQFAPRASNATPYPLHYPIREVCYCNKKGWGWRWEVHLDTGEVFRVDGNTELENRYHITPGTPTP